MGETGSHLTRGELARSVRARRMRALASPGRTDAENPCLDVKHPAPSFKRIRDSLCASILGLAARIAAPRGRVRAYRRARVRVAERSGRPYQAAQVSRLLVEDK